MSKRKYLGKSALLFISLALFLVSLWEVCVRLDAMYAPIKMFFSMAYGEGIPLSTAIKYVDLSLLEAPLWLLGCIITALLSLALASRPRGSAFILVLSIAMALYGLTRKGIFLTDFWRLVQPGLLLAQSALASLNLLALPIQNKLHARKAAPPPDPPRMTDAPRLRNISKSDIHNDSSRRAG